MVCFPFVVLQNVFSTATLNLGYVEIRKMSQKATRQKKSYNHDVFYA